MAGIWRKGAGRLASKCLDVLAIPAAAREEFGVCQFRRYSVFVWALTVPAKVYADKGAVSRDQAMDCLFLNHFERRAWSEIRETYWLKELQRYRLPRLIHR